jgi:transcription elongation factor Elf1
MKLISDTGEGHDRVKAFSCPRCGHEETWTGYDANHFDFTPDCPKCEEISKAMPRSIDFLCWLDTVIERTIKKSKDTP